MMSDILRKNTGINVAAVGCMASDSSAGPNPVALVVAHSERATEQLLVVTDELVATTLERDALLEHLAVARAKAEHWKCEHDAAAREA